MVGAVVCVLMFEWMGFLLCMQFRPTASGGGVNCKCKQQPFHVIFRKKSSLCCSYCCCLLLILQFLNIECVRKYVCISGLILMRLNCLESNGLVRMAMPSSSKET